MGYDQNQRGSNFGWNRIANLLESLVALFGGVADRSVDSGTVTVGATPVGLPAVPAGTRRVSISASGGDAVYTTHSASVPSGNPYTGYPLADGQTQDIFANDITSFRIVRAGSTDVRMYYEIKK